MRGGEGRGGGGEGRGGGGGGGEGTQWQLTHGIEYVITHRGLDHVVPTESHVAHKVEDVNYAFCLNLS